MVKQRTFLLVDDDPDDTFLFGEVLHDIDPSIVFLTAANGQEALDMLKSTTSLPDLIFLDLNMPRCNGFDILKNLKGSELKEVPVVIFTTSRNQLHIDKAYQQGAALYLPKPFSYSALEGALKALLALDWNHPDSITNAYCADGTYKAYSVG